MVTFFFWSLDELQPQLHGGASNLNCARARRVTGNFVTRPGQSMVIPSGVASTREALVSFAAVKRQLLDLCEGQRNDHGSAESQLRLASLDGLALVQLCAGSLVLVIKGLRRPL